MSQFRNQMEAIGTALLLIQRLPGETIWSLTCTNDDDADSPSVLNIFADSSTWPHLSDSLGLGRTIDIGDEFRSYRQGTLLISLIEGES